MLQIYSVICHVQINSSQLEITQVVQIQETETVYQNRYQYRSVCDCALLSNGKEFIEYYACRDEMHIKCIGLSKREFNKLKTSGTT